MNAVDAEINAAAPAKINVCLLVRARRADGFHDVISLMAPLALADELEITVGQGRGVELEVTGGGRVVPAGPKNLAARAASAFAAAAGLDFAAAIKLKKNIPVGAGLGGGSSDAATVLRTLNDRFGQPLGADRLWRVARELGSDVPFFLAGGWALVTGRGEFVTPAAGPAGVPLLVAAPDLGVPTARVYEELGPSDFAADADAVWACLAALAGPPAAWWRAGVNSLEAPACRRFPALAELKGVLSTLGYGDARLTGSGGAFVAPAADAAHAAEAVAELTARGYRATTTTTA
jgi:4-diphosphocytidyl-2-C-methyl-D-erythritol kinase